MSTAQIGIEFVVPGIGSTDPEVVAANRSRLAASSAAMLRRLDAPASSVAHDYLDLRSKDARIRIVFHGLTLTRNQMQALWKQYEPTGYCTLKLGLGPSELLLWAFSGMEPILMEDGATRAAVLGAIKDSRLTRITGEFYSPLPPAELKRLREERKAQHPEVCSCCGDALIEIPPDQQVVMTVEEIESQYDHVEWESGYDPFYSQRERNRVIANGPTSNKSARDIQESPENRYGPS